MGLMKAAYLEEELLSPEIAMKREKERQDYDRAEKPAIRERIESLEKRGLPIPRVGTPEISEDHLDVEALWFLLPVEDRDRIGILALGMLVGAVISNLAKGTAPAAETSGTYYHERCLDQLLELSDVDVPPLITDVLKGQSWRLPHKVESSCHSCGRFTNLWSNNYTQRLQDSCKSLLISHFKYSTIA